MSNQLCAKGFLLQLNVIIHNKLIGMVHPTEMRVQGLNACKHLYSDLITVVEGSLSALLSKVLNLKYC